MRKILTILVFAGAVCAAVLYFKLGTTNAVTCAPGTGMMLAAGDSLIVGTSGMSYIALVAGDQQVTQLYLTSGS